MGEIEVQASRSRTEHTLELLAPVWDMDGAFEGDIAEGAELVHHQLLHGKLVDNLLFHRTLGREFLDVEVDIEVFLLLEVVDTAHGLDGQPLVGGMHLDIPEEEGRVVAAEEYRQFQGHLEVLQHLCKGSRDILQERLAVDERRLEKELAAFFLTRQHHVGRIEVEDGVLMLQDNVAQMGILLRGAHREVEVLHIEARQRIFRHKTPFSSLRSWSPHHDVVAREIEIVEIEVHSHQIDEFLAVHQLFIFRKSVSMFCIESLESIKVLPCAFFQVSPVLHHVNILQSIVVREDIVGIASLTDVEHSLIHPIDIHDSWFPSLPVQVCVRRHNTLNDGIPHI